MGDRENCLRTMNDPAGELKPVSESLLWQTRQAGTVASGAAKSGNLRHVFVSPAAGIRPLQCAQRGRWGAVLALALAMPGLTSRTARAELQNLATLVPRDVFAFYTVDPPSVPSSGSPNNSLEIATVLIDQAFAMGFLKSLDIVYRGWLDAIATVSLVTAHPHSVMLFDLQVQKDEQESHRVSRLRAAIVLQTKGDSRAIERRIQHLLASYAEQDFSKLETHEIGGHSFHRFTDTRLTDWMDLWWGGIGENFIIAIGEESVRSLVSVLNGSAESAWSSPEYRRGVEALSANGALITVQIRFDEVRSKSRQLGAKLTRMQADLGLAGCERGFWAAGYSGRSLEIRQWIDGSQNAGAASITSEKFLAHNDRLLPGEANSYAAFGIVPSIWFERIRAAYLSARSRKNARESREYWHTVEQSAGLRFSELFAALGGPLVVHDYPAHALRLPPAWTVVAPIQGDPNLVRSSIDALMEYWRAQLSGSPLILTKSADGIWFLNLGLEGPAIHVTDRWLVFSFSPHAVRRNAQMLSGDQGPSASDPP